MNRREFFRGARTAVVGAAAAGATLALGLPALPKKASLLDQMTQALTSYPHWRKFRKATIISGLPTETWRRLYQGTIISGLPTETWRRLYQGTLANEKAK
jgi:2-polyprenyl-6-methoxyphenol hydroxylase-like FAD-dependent oxidoreductase